MTNKNWKPGEQLSAMLRLVVEKFEGVVDLGGRPYIQHCLRVMHYADVLGDEELNCACLGHDLLEDGYDSVEEGVADLRRRGFTEQVISDILCVTKLPDEPYDVYQAKVLASRRGRRIKKGDLTDNQDTRRLKRLREKDIARMRAYAAFYAAIEEADQRAGS